MFSGHFDSDRINHEHFVFDDNFFMKMKLVKILYCQSHTNCFKMILMCKCCSHNVEYFKRVLCA